MHIQDERMVCRKIRTVISEQEIFDLLTAEVAKRAYQVLDRHVTSKVFISQKERTGTAGFEYYATVEIVDDLAARELAKNPPKESPDDDDRCQQ